MAQILIAYVRGYRIFKFVLLQYLDLLMYELYWVCIILLGYASDILLGRKLLSVLLVRKAATAIGLGAPAVVVFLLAITDNITSVWKFVSFCLAISLTSFFFSGCLISYMEVAPRYAGVIFAMGESLSLMYVLSNIFDSYFFLSSKRIAKQWITTVEQIKCYQAELKSESSKII